MLAIQGDSGLTGIALEHFRIILTHSNGLCNVTFSFESPQFRIRENSTFEDDGFNRSKQHTLKTL